MQIISCHYRAPAAIIVPMTKYPVYLNLTGKRVVVIGAGSGGLVTAYIAAAVKSKVTLIEKNKMGGDCLNTGCVPSKALIRSARFLSQVDRASEFGINAAEAHFEFAEVMERVQNVVNTVAPHDSIERYTELGVDVVTGSAKMVSLCVRGVSPATHYSITLNASARADLCSGFELMVMKM